jgi:hypothetical protein
VWDAIGFWVLPARCLRALSLSLEFPISANTITQSNLPHPRNCVSSSSNCSLHSRRTDNCCPQRDFSIAIPTHHVEVTFKLYTNYFCFYTCIDSADKVTIDPHPHSFWVHIYSHADTELPMQLALTTTLRTLKRLIGGRGNFPQQKDSKLRRTVTSCMYIIPTYAWALLFILSTYSRKQTPWRESTSELYQPSDRSVSSKLLPTFADRGVSCSQRGGSPMAVFSVW